MVVALCDQFSHLIESVLSSTAHMHCYIRDLCPYNYAVFVAQVVEFLRVLIVGEPERVRSEFPDYVHIRSVIFRSQRVASSLEILMSGDAAQRVASAVEEESFSGIKLIYPASESCGYLISAAESCRRSVEIRITESVPQTDIFYQELGCGMTFLRRYRLPEFNRIPFGVDPGQRHLNAVRVLPRLYGHNSRLFLKIRHRRDLYSECSVFYKFKVFCRYRDEVHIAVQSAVESEICFLGINGIVVAVVNGYCKCVLLCKFSCKFCPESGVSAAVFRDLFSVEIDLGAHRRAVYLEKQSLSRTFFRGQFSHIPASSTVIVVPAVLSVCGIPCMGNGHGLAAGGIFHGCADRHIMLQKSPSVF